MFPSYGILLLRTVFSVLWGFEIKTNTMLSFAKTFLVIVFLLFYFEGKCQSVELMAGHKNTQGDIQWLKSFSVKSKFLFYNRNRFTVDYDNKTTYFISGITAYKMGKQGFGIANEMLITNEGWLAKVGIQYLKSSENLTAYVWLNSGYLKEWKYAFFSFIRYQPRLNDHWKWYLQLEVVNNFNAKGNEFSAQRPRLGVGINGMQFGLAGDINQIGPKSQFIYNAGAFFRKEF